MREPHEEILHPTVRRLQEEHGVWLDHNFPEQTGWQPLLGLAEEVGELAHAYLKHDQKIRTVMGNTEYYNAASDAVGDIFIYLMSFCNTEGIDLETVIVDTWSKVRMRDWQQDRLSGGQ